MTLSTTELSKLFDKYTTTITLYKDAIDGDAVELQGCITAQAELQADILALFQAREQQVYKQAYVDAEDDHARITAAMIVQAQQQNLQRYLGEDVVLEQIGDGKYKVYANPEYIKAAKQQLLTELLENKIDCTYLEQVMFTTQKIEAVPVSVIEAKLKEVG